MKSIGESRYLYMDFWKKTGHRFEDLVSMPEHRLIILLNIMSRHDIIEWLSWNDPNGIYTDELSIKEFGNTMSREEGMEILIRQIEENRTPA